MPRISTFIVLPKPPGSMSLPSRQSVRGKVPAPLPPSAKKAMDDAAPYAEVVEDDDQPRDWLDNRINPIVVGAVAVLVGLTAFAVFTFLF